MTHSDEIMQEARIPDALLKQAGMIFADIEEASGTTFELDMKAIDAASHVIARALLARDKLATERERQRCAALLEAKADEYEAELDMWACAHPIAVRLRGSAASILAGGSDGE